MYINLFSDGGVLHFQDLLKSHANVSENKWKRFYSF